jgi:predicted nucleic acid-binding protein
MRIVLDTNVLMSGIFWSGPPYETLKAWKQGKISLVVSQEILFESRELIFKRVFMKTA